MPQRNLFSNFQASKRTPELVFRLTRLVLMLVDSMVTTILPLHTTTIFGFLDIKTVKNFICIFFRTLCITVRPVKDDALQFFYIDPFSGLVTLRKPLYPGSSKTTYTVSAVRLWFWCTI